MLTPALAATQALGYVRPSQPHTGAKIFVQIVGRFSHTPRPEHVPSRNLQ
jgi:hypothetical protein